MKRDGVALIEQVGGSMGTPVLTPASFSAGHLGPPISIDKEPSELQENN